MVDFQKAMKGVEILERFYADARQAHDATGALVPLQPGEAYAIVHAPAPGDADAALYAIALIKKIAADPNVAQAFAAGVALGQSLGLKGAP